MDEEGGHLLNLSSSGEAGVAGPTNLETESTHTGGSEHKNSQIKVSHGGQSHPRPVASLTDKGHPLPSVSLSAIFWHQR